MKKDVINYAVVGLGHIAQVAVLPAFKNSENSELFALVSGDETKLRVLSKKYNIENTYIYDEFEACLDDDRVDAVYIALPNHLHYSCARLAAEAGKHILCEKPLTVTTKDAEELLRIVNNNGVKLMTAYRLHFDPTNLKAIQLVQQGKIGEPLFFTSEFGHQVKDNNIRAKPEEGGTPLHDLGIYCINAARYLLRDEPIAVFATCANPSPRLSEIDQTVTAVLRFPNEKLATFTCSFASAEISNLRIVGSKGDLFIKNVYEYVGEVKSSLTINDKTKTWSNKAGDQFAAELDYFSNCILKDKNPEPSGLEGLIDLEIIEALLQSIDTGKVVRLKTHKNQSRPVWRQAIRKTPHKKPQLVHAQAESR